MQTLILLAGLLVAHLDGAICRRLVCVYQSSSSEITANPCDINRDINVNLCTDLIFSFVEPNGAFQISPSPSDLVKFSDFNGLKSSNPSLKTLLEIDLRSTPRLIFTPANRAIFIQSVLTVLDDVNFMQFDGVNILWVNQADDKQKFTLLMQELKTALGTRMLTASVSGVIADIDDSYEVPALADLVDFFNVMTFDLDRTPAVPGSFPNAQAAMQHLLSQGAPVGKLNMGIATYGVGVGPGPSAGILGVRAKYEVCRVSPLPASVHIDSDATIDAKAQYIVDNGFGGAYVKSLDLDDFNGNCGQGNYPVISRL